MSICCDHSSHSLLPTTPSLRRRLRLIVREEEKGDNLFVRLSPTVASDLHSLASDHHSFDQCSTFLSGSGDAWTLFDEKASALVSFLPLSISAGDDVTIFASYNGGTYGLSSDHDAIEVPRSILPEISSGIPEFVFVHALLRVDYGIQVLVEPLTFEDWELLEVYCDFVKDGGLLSQVSVVHSFQDLTVRINETERVRIRVKEITTGTSSSIENQKSVWPDITSELIESGTRPERKCTTSSRCVLLIQDTEIIVQPKTRPRKKDTSWLNPFQLIPSDADWDASLEMLLRVTKRTSLHVEPGCVLVNTEDWPSQSEWAHVRPENSNQSRIVRVATFSEIPPTNAVLFIGTRFDLRLSLYQDCICLRPLTYIRKESLENVMLEEILFEYEQKSSETWNVPNIGLANSYRKGNISTVNYEFDQTFPLGAIIPMSSFPSICSSQPIDNSDRWFRITSKENHSCAEGFVVSLEVHDILNLLKEHLYICKGFVSTHVVQEAPTLHSPNRVITSTDWTKPIIDRMKYFSSTIVTLHGVSGSGKTFNAILLSTLLSFNFHRPIFYLDCKELQKSKPRMIEILEEIDIMFTRLIETQGSIIVLDDLDSLSPNLFGGDGIDASERTQLFNPAAIDQSKLIGDQLSNLFKAMESRGTTYYVIATCSDADDMNPSILKASEAHVIHSKVPSLSAADQSTLLMEILCPQNLQSPFDFDRSDISRRTEGFLPRDFEKISLRALRAHRSKLFELSLKDSLIAEFENFTPTAQISSVKDQNEFDASWDDIGGLFRAKETLESILLHPLRYRRIYGRSRIQLPRGILLYGPPGCGKSYLVPALARECNYPLITCKGPEMLDRYIGASETKVRELFERASAMAPSILFLDELESLAPRRGSDSTGVTDRVVNQLLTFLDGVEDLSSGTVFIIGATSRPDKVDPAIIRPGRLERHLYIGPPKSMNEWSDLVIKIAKNWNFNEESLRSLSVQGETVTTLIDQPRLCPADVRAAFDTAHLNAVHRALTGHTNWKDTKKIELDMDDIKFALRETNPSLSEDESKILESTYDYFRGNRFDLSADAKRIHRGLKTSLR